MPNFQVDQFWDRDEHVKCWGKKVKVEGHSGYNMLENALFGLVSTSYKPTDGSSPDWLLVYLRPKMNWLDFEGRGVNVKVTVRSGVKKLGLYLLKSLKYHSHILVKAKVASRSNI